ncbi:hypothetical protein BE08_15585 [Sorangium cellulosum]|uniref:Uncharacterized protein n=1 Tax=Sorangium cellulosum TaxID=56 RepID=A0A150P0S1_SORCE|nr:hypothetical protein BE08_15585 [Sorangium cellulosum]
MYFSSVRASGSRSAAAVSAFDESASAVSALAVSARAVITSAVSAFDVSAFDVSALCARTAWGAVSSASWAGASGSSDATHALVESAATARTNAASFGDCTMDDVPPGMPVGCCPVSSRHDRRRVRHGCAPRRPVRTSWFNYTVREDACGPARRCRPSSLQRQMVRCH